MNRRGLKQASRQCLRDAQISPMRMTLIFLLCAYLVVVPGNILSYVLQCCLDRLKGLSSIGLRNRYNLWITVITVIVNVAWLLWNAGYTAYTIRLSRGERAAFDDFYTGFRMFGKVLAVLVLQFLFIWLWSCLFLVPGLIAAYRYRMALFLQLDHPEYSAMECINRSKELTQGHKGELFVLDLSFLWYYLLSTAADVLMILFYQNAFPLRGWAGFLTSYLIGLAVSTVVSVLWQPYVETTMAHAYNWLLSMHPSASGGAQLPHSPEAGGPEF